MNDQMQDTEVATTEPSKKQLLNVLGGTGTSIQSGMIFEEENPELTGQQGMITYHKMRTRSAPVAALLKVIKLPIESTERYIEPASGEKQDVEVADFVRAVLFDSMDKTFAELLSEILTEIDFGFSLFEKIYKVDDEGRIIISDLAYRKQETIQKRTTETGEKGVTQQLYTKIEHGPNAGKTIVSIPAYKLVRFTYDQEGTNYEGRSALRYIYQNYFMMDRLYRYDIITAERMSMPVPTIYLPEGAQPEDKTAAEIIVKNVRTHQQNGAVFPGPKGEKGWFFEFVSPDMSKTKDLDKSIQMHKRDIFLSGLAQFLMLGSGETGSYALSEDQSSLFLLSLVKIANQISSVVNEHVIKEMVDFNYEVLEYPKLKFQKIGSVEYEKIIKAVTDGMAAGAITADEGIETYLRKTLGLPPKMETQEEEEKPTKEKTQPGETEEEDEEIDDTAEKLQEAEVQDKNTKSKKSEMKKATHTHGPACTHDEEYMGYARLFNNKLILEAQGQLSDDERKKLKKKGFAYNKYEGQARRPLTFAEKKVNIVLLKQKIQEFETLLNDQLTTVNQKIKDDILRQVKKAVDNNDIKAVENITVKYKNELAGIITDIQKQMFEIGKKSAAAEMGVEIPATKKEITQALRIQNDAIVDKFITDLDAATKTTVAQLIQKNATISAVASMSAVEEVGTMIDKTVQKVQSTINTLSVTGTLNLGRGSIFERYPEQIYAMQYSAILDEKTSNTCLSLDGRVVKKGSKEYYDYSPPRHHNCRSVRVEILNSEVFKPAITGIPSSIPGGGTIDTYQEIKAPVLDKNSPALRVINQEIKERKEKLEVLRTQDQYPNRQKQHEKAIQKLESSLRKAAIDVVKKSLVNGTRKNIHEQKKRQKNV